MDGILLVDKAANMTSHDVVAHIRKHFRINKVGHAGTLDPFATGLLILCLGQATKIAQYLVGCDKEYLAVMKLGETTDTQDYTGQVLGRRSGFEFSKEAIAEVCAKFRGEISQVPPMYSAKKVQGKRLYKIARAGKTVKREAQTVKIYELDVLETRLPYIWFRVVCSKGTYVRTLAHDIGAMLGCGAHLTELRRTNIGPFAVSNGVPFEELVKMTKQSVALQCLIPLDKALSFLPAVNMNESASTRLAHGSQVILAAGDISGLVTPGYPDQIVRIYSLSGSFIALARGTPIDQDGESRWQFRPIRVFVR